jgi:hypothetical protein
MGKTVSDSVIRAGVPGVSERMNRKVSSFFIGLNEFNTGESE